MNLKSDNKHKKNSSLSLLVKFFTYVKKRWKLLKFSSWNAQGKLIANSRREKQKLEFM